MIQKTKENEHIVAGKIDPNDNVLKNAPHTLTSVISTEWNHPYSREEAVFPAEWVEENKFVTDPSQIEKCINKKTVALMIPNLLGNIADWKKINKIAKKYNLRVIEDSADTIGYTINKKNVGY